MIWSGLRPLQISCILTWQMAIFAPALFFPDLVAGLRARTALPIHVHLMVDDAVLI